jgi:hypothetical protein
MNPFFALERFCAELVERTFASVFPSSLEPVQIARRMVSVLEATNPPPTEYRISLNPRDHEELASELPDLIASWEAMLTEMARRLGLPLAQAPRISILDNPMIVRGSVRVDYDPGESIIRLRVLRGIPANAVLAITKTAIIGRAPESDLSLFDPSVSRRHASFKRNGETLEFHDLGSSNGSFFERRRVEKTTLHRGDIIVLGNCELLVE